MGKSLTTENVRDEIRKVELEARELMATAMKAREDMLAAGVNPLEDDAAREKLADMFKAADLKRQDLTQLQAKAAELAWMDGMASGAGFGAAGGYQDPERRHVASRPGDRFVASAEYRRLHESGAFANDQAFMAQVGMRGFERPVEIISRAELQDAMNFRATTITGGGATSAGPFIQNDLVPGYVAYLTKPATLLGLVDNQTTDSDVVEYVSQSAPTTNAAETAEDSAATEAVLPFATNTTNVREIVMHIPVTLQSMKDSGQVRGVIEGELISGVLDRLDTQIASGAGTGSNLSGIYTTVTQAQALGGDSRPDAIHKAITQIRAAAGVYLEPDAIGIHPNDLQDLILETDANGQYLFGPPSMPGSRSCWGIPLVVSTAFTSGTPLVGAFRRGARFWLREGVNVSSGLDGNDFTKRRVTLLAAMRGAFATIRATAFTEVTGF